MMKLVVFASVLAVALGAWNGDPKLAQILRSDSDVSPDGSYQWAYDTENGISAAAAGSLKSFGGTETPAVVEQGNFQWQSPEGVPVAIQYIADENGYQPQGDILPTPPPVPAAILRALEYIAAHPQAQEPQQLGRRYK